MLRILYLPTAQEIPLEGIMGSTYEEVDAFIKNGYNRFYYSTYHKGPSWTTCAPYISNLGNEIPKHQIQLVEVLDVRIHSNAGL